MLDKIEEAIEDIKLGKMVIVVDDEDRENEGDFVMAASKITPDAINTMASLGRGLICTPMSKQIAQKFKIPLMVKQNDSAHHTAFTVSIDHKEAGTGISCVDRAKTIAALVDKNTKPDDFLRPGHIFPLVAKDGGVSIRPGHTEASVDLCRLAGEPEVGVICEIMNVDGTMARLPQLRVMASEHNFKLISIKDLRAYLEINPLEPLISERFERQSVAMPTKHGEFQLTLFEDHIAPDHMVVLHMGDLTLEGPTLVRVHSECLTGDVFGSMRCDCGDQLEQSMKKIAEKKRGAIVYLRQEGRGIGLPNKIRAYSLQEQGLNTYEANQALGLPVDDRTYDHAVYALKQLGVKEVELITNNPKKIDALKQADFRVVNRHAIRSSVSAFNLDYLTAKKNLTNHQIEFLN
tara:strand:+ start:15082 stop:16296 length:1215 start_codon:yes stop_codon:yes gene_type:complete